MNIDGFTFRVTGYKCNLPEDHQIVQISKGFLEVTFDGKCDQSLWGSIEIPPYVFSYIKTELEGYLKIPVLKAIARVYREAMTYENVFHLALTLDQYDIDNYESIVREEYLDEMF